MHDPIETCVAKQAAQEVAVAKVPIDEEPVRHGIAPSRRQVVQCRDIDTGLAQDLDHVRLDVASATYDQHMH